MSGIYLRGRRLATICVALLVGRLTPIMALLLSLSASSLCAQEALPSNPVYDATAREQMYQQLFRDVAELERQGNILKTVVKLVSPTVVHIEAQRTEGSRNYGRSRTIEEAGSGVIIQLDSKLYVVTNRHVIREAALTSIDIGLSDGRRIHPDKVWTNRDTDVAVMSVSAPNLIHARIGDSDKIDIGDFAVAVGSPFGLSHSVTYGIISAKGRRDLELGDGAIRYQDFMQTDAAINPGNSGGPLINLRGEVIGINTAIASNSGGNEGIGFSIPINMAMAVVRQLVESGTVARAFLGVTLDSKFSPEIAQQLGMPRRAGAHIIRITPGSPAETAKLQVDDIILQFNGIPIDDDNHLVNVISLTKIGTEVPVLVFRAGKTFVAKTLVGDFDQFQKLVEPAKP